MSQDPTITVCIPAFQASSHLERAIRSAQAQTWPNVTIHIAVDPGDDDTEAIALRFADDQNIRITRHSKRLGWTGNTNFLLDEVETPYFSILFHDDEMHPDYLASLLTIIRQRPGTIGAFADMRRIKSGASDGLQTAKSLVGDQQQRVRAAMMEQNPATCLRGLISSKALAEGLRLIKTPFDSLGADFAFAPMLACHGEVLRLPEPLYIKHVNPVGVSQSWWKWPPERLALAFASCGASTIHHLRKLADFDQPLLGAECSAWLENIADGQVRSRLSDADSDILSTTFHAALRVSLATDKAAPPLTEETAPVHVSPVIKRSLARRRLRLSSYAGRAKNWPEARQQAETAVQHDPDFTAARERLALCLARERRVDEAITLAEQCAPTADVSPLTYVALGTAHMQRAAWTEARESLLLGLELDQENAQLLELLCRVELELRNLDQAYQYISRARKSDRENPRFVVLADDIRRMIRRSRREKKRSHTPRRSRE